MISMIVAKSKNNVIGYQNRIPWRIRNDLIRLKSLIMGKVVIAGRKTYESIAEYYDKSGRPMPARQYIIVTRSADYETHRGNALTTQSLDEAIKKAKDTSDEVFIIGGAEIFKQALPIADRLYVTEIDTEITGDSFFPAINTAEWTEKTREKHTKDADHDYNYDFVIYDRIKTDA